jgi:hypothetical protein
MDEILLSSEALESVEKAGAFIFGSLATRSPYNLGQLELLLAIKGPLKFFDVNLRPPFADPKRIVELAAYADVIKLNHEEVGQLASWLRTGEAVDTQTVVQTACGLGAIVASHDGATPLLSREVIQPALSRGNVGNIADPNLIGPFRHQVGDPAGLSSAGDYCRLWANLARLVESVLCLTFCKKLNWRIDSHENRQWGRSAHHAGFGHGKRSTDDLATDQSISATSCLLPCRYCAMISPK